MAPVTPQVPANILEGAKKQGWYANSGLENMSFGGTGFNQPSTGGSNNSLLSKIQELKNAGLNPADFKDMLTLNALLPQQQNWDQRKQELDYVAQQKREEADYRQKLGEQSTQKALLYSSLGNLGNQIATGIGGTPEQWRQIYNLPAVYNDTLRSFPTATITPSATSAIGQRNYFG
jgi:hypothetical protein